MAPVPNVTLGDMQLVLNGIEQLAIILGVVIVVSVLLRKKDLIPQKFKNLVMLLVGLWTLAIIFQYAISAYSYVHYLRPLQQQGQRQNIGL